MMNWRDVLFIRYLIRRIIVPTHHHQCEGITLYFKEFYTEQNQGDPTAYKLVRTLT